MVDFSSKSCPLFFDHWMSLRGDAPMPENTVFFDNAQPDFAPSTYIVELIDETTVVRLMGTRLVEQWGLDHTGKIVGSAQGDGIEQAWYFNALHIASHPCGMLVNSYFKSTKGRTSMIESIALPIASSAGLSNRVVSYTEVVDDLGYRERPDVWLETPKILWVDIGHGCPTDPPIMR